MSTLGYRSLFLGSVLIVAALDPGCSCAGDVNLGRDDGGMRDGGPRRPRADECGNGVDDDANGKIDDGCPCGPGETQACFGGAVASRGVGTCAAGVQVCVALAGVEWGDWGDSACDGDVLPATEACDGMDHDCDGAVDEDCPCTAGESRNCGSVFSIAPCRGGAQSCAPDGTWGGCDGAISPTADICLPSGEGDGIDQDCDGTADEGCECDAVPEVCRDSIDNDCDGVVDERECTPDWPPADAGVDASAPPTDGGASTCGTFSGPTCVPTVTLISEFAQLEMRLASAGCEFAVYHSPPGARQEMRLDRFDTSGTRLSSTLIDTSGRSDEPTANLAHGPTGWAMIYGRRMDGPPFEMERRVAFLDASGSLIRPPLLVGSEGPSFLRSGFLFWDGVRWVAVWGHGGTGLGGFFVAAALIDPVTFAFTVVEHPVPSAPQVHGAVWTGDRLIVPMTVGGAAGAVELHSFDRSLTPIGVTPVAVGSANYLALAHDGTNVYLVWDHLAATGMPHPVWLATLTPALALAGAPTVIFDDIGARAENVSIAIEGARMGIGAGHDFRAPGTHARFGTTSALGPIEDLRPFGATTDGWSEVHVAVAPRRAVLWSDRRDLVNGPRLILSCDP